MEWLIIRKKVPSRNFNCYRVNDLSLKAKKVNMKMVELEKAPK